MGFPFINTAGFPTIAIRVAPARQVHPTSPQSIRHKYSRRLFPSLEQTRGSMADLSELAKRLQEQVDVITKHLAKEKLPAPSFIPSADVDPLNSAMQKLPADVEEARGKAQALSWSITQLLTPPAAYMSWTIFKVPELVPLPLTDLVLRRCGPPFDHRKRHR